MSENRDYWQSIPTDEIKLEISDLSPTQEKQLNETLGKICNLFQENWGEYFSDTSKIIFPDIPARIFASDTYTFSRFYLHYRPSRNALSEEANSKHVTLSRGEKESKAILFEECGADFYAYKILKKLNKSFDRLPSVEKYSALINLHGNTVHKVFFGTARDDEKISVMDTLHIAESHLPINYSSRVATEGELLASARRKNGVALLGSKIVIKNSLAKKSNNLIPRMTSLVQGKSTKSQPLVLSASELKTLCHETAHLLQDPNLDEFMRSYDK